MKRLLLAPLLLVCTLLVPRTADAYPTIQCDARCLIVDSSYVVPKVPKVRYASLEVARAADVLSDATPAPAIGTSPSAPLPNLEDPAAAGAAAWGALSNGNVAFGVVLALITGLGLLRKLWPKPFETDFGGASLAFATSLLVGMATGMSTGAELSWSLMKISLMIAVGATGGYAVIWKRIAKPALRWLADKLGLDTLGRALS